MFAGSREIGCKPTSFKTVTVMGPNGELLKKYCPTRSVSLHDNQSSLSLIVCKKNISNLV